MAPWLDVCSVLHQQRTQEAEVTMMGIVFFLGFGLIAGLFAWAIMAGTARRGLASTVVIGLTGSFFGDSLLSYTAGEQLYALHRSGVVGSVAGAVFLLFAACSIFRDNVRPTDTRRAEYESRRLMHYAADRHTGANSPRPSPLFSAARQRAPRRQD